MPASIEFSIYLFVVSLFGGWLGRHLSDGHCSAIHMGQIPLAPDFILSPHAPLCLGRNNLKKLQKQILKPNHKKPEI
jgi:hypothetical protein